MADESLHIPSADQNIDFCIVTLFERLEALRKDNKNDYIGRLSTNSVTGKRSMQAEIRTLEFWKSIIAECLSSFFYVFIVCGAAAGAGVGASVSSVLLATALASGFAIATLTQCFMNVSGAHINPAITLAACVIRAITPLRTMMYITAQCGGGIAAAGLLYGITGPGYQGNLQAAIAHSSSLAAWERFCVEFVLTFILVFSYLVSMDSYKKYLGNAPLSIGAAYSACSFVSMPYLNPARSLGPSFVLNKWDHHWVYWFGPLVGGAISGIIYEYVLKLGRNSRKSKENIENDSSSIHSEDDLNYDLDEKSNQMQNPKFQGSSYRAPTGTMNQQSIYCGNFYTTAPLSKVDPEPLYSGTRSMYCRSPPLTRANLNRSQSVYAKSNTAINRDLIPRPGPLVPTQSLYPLRVTHTGTQNSHVQNQNMQNQLQQRSESIYGIRGSTRQQPPTMQQQQTVQAFEPVYGTRQNPTPPDGSKFDREDKLQNRNTNRPDSVYGTAGQRGRGQSAQSDDSSYGSYHGSAVTPPARNGEIMMYAPPQGMQPGQIQQQRQVERKVSNGGNVQCATNERQQPQNISYTTKPLQIGNGTTQTPNITHQQYTLVPMRQN